MNTNDFSPWRGTEPRMPEEGVQESIFQHIHELNITDGGEFLDDAIRIKDQPLRLPKRKKNGKSLRTYVERFL